MVFDSVAGEGRDVDITIQVVNDSGQTSVFEGIEVKYHGRPLDVSHVEQLCAKLNDMPSISKRGIVSGSGYTVPAVRKAIHNNVDLYDFRNWKSPMKLGKITFSKELIIEEEKIQWIGIPRVTLITSLKRAQSGNVIFNQNAPVYNISGNLLVSSPTCKDLMQRLQLQAINFISNQIDSFTTDAGEAKLVNIEIPLENGLYTTIEGKKIPLSKAIVSGEIKNTGVVLSPNYKGLYKYGEQQPYVGCAIFEMSYGNLAGFVVDTSDTLRFMTIPVADRLLKKIYHKSL